MIDAAKPAEKTPLIALVATIKGTVEETGFFLKHHLSLGINVIDLFQRLYELPPRELWILGTPGLVKRIRLKEDLATYARRSPKHDRYVISFIVTCLRSGELELILQLLWKEFSRP